MGYYVHWLELLFHPLDARSLVILIPVHHTYYQYTIGHTVYIQKGILILSCRSFQWANIGHSWSSRLDILYYLHAIGHNHSTSSVILFPSSWPFQWVKHRSFWFQPIGHIIYMSPGIIILLLHSFYWPKLYSLFIDVRSWVIPVPANHSYYLHTIGHTYLVWWGNFRCTYLIILISTF